MPWIPKAGAPASFSLAQSFAALIAGDTSWNWLASYVPLIPPTQYDTAYFCSMGPAPAPQLTTQDFINAVTGGYGGAQSVIGQAIGAKLAQIAYDRMFQALCVTSTGGWTDPVCNDVAADASSYDYPGFVNVPLPLGAEQVRITWVDVQGAAYVWTLDGDLNMNWNGVNHESDPGPTQQTFAPLAGTGYVHVASDGTRATICLEFLMPAGAGYTATAQPEPSGITAPATNVYDTIGDLGAELDRQELKLDYILAIVTSLANEIPHVVGAPGEPQELLEGQVVDVSSAAGAVFVLTQMPPQADVVFSTPPVIYHLGKIFWGDAAGWHEPQEFRTSPQVVLPKPQGATQLKVNLVRGALASVRLIPAGIPL